MTFLSYVVPLLLRKSLSYNAAPRDQYLLPPVPSPPHRCISRMGGPGGEGEEGEEGVAVLVLIDIRNYTF